MKDWYMIFALLAVIATPMFPYLLKTKCPKCGKRKLEHLETVKNEDSAEYYTFYRCHACLSDFRQKRSGKLELLAQEQLGTAEPEFASSTR